MNHRIKSKFKIYTHTFVKAYTHARVHLQRHFWCNGEKMRRDYFFQRDTSITIFVRCRSFLISSLNNWADRGKKFLASFFERRSGGCFAVLSVATGNALNGTFAREDPRASFSGETHRSRKKGKRELEERDRPSWGW